VIATVHPTIPDAATFAVSAAVIMGGAVGVITSRHSVHAALSLIGTLFGVAVLFIEEQADFLAAVQVIVYAGAIVVLFLFVIMFLGVDRRENVAYEPLHGQRPLALALIVVAVGGIIALGVGAHWSTGAHAVAGPRTLAHHGNVYVLGKSVFTTYLFAFEATAALLVIAVVGAVVLARRPKLEAESAAETGANGPADGELPPADAFAVVEAGRDGGTRLEEEVAR
jgi:NADH-quinone oxidoreductase subunit J